MAARSPLVEDIDDPVRYCRARAAMAWSDRERARWHRLAKKNEEWAKSGYEDPETRPEPDSPDP